ATNAVLAVVSAHSCGLGGDAFWLIWPGEGGPWHSDSAGSGTEAARAAEPKDGAADSNDRVLERLIGLNGSGRSGSLATIDRVRGEGQTEMPMFSPLSITV